MIQRNSPSVARMIFHMLVNGVWMSLLFPFALLLLPLDPKGGSVWMARRIWAPLLVKVSGARLVVHGSQNVDPRRPTIYMSNHSSSLDIPVLFMAIPVDFRYVAKSSLRWIPVLGWYLWAAGHILIDRGVRHKAMESLKRAGAKIRRGTSIVVYPEGTRSEDGRILPFKKGGFALAIESGVAVCPVTIEGTSRLMPKNSWRINRVEEIHVKIGAPLDASAYGPHGREALMRDVRSAIIAQSLELGGPGGVGDDAVTAPRREGAGPTRAALG